MLNLSSKRKIRILLFSVFTIFSLLIVRIGYIQLIQGKELQQLAYQQQSLDRKINPKRGTIYDSTEKYVLAVSSTVYTYSGRRAWTPTPTRDRTTAEQMATLSARGIAR